MEKYENMSEEELIQRLRRGDQNCMDVLIEKYRGLVKNQARALYLIGGDQEDLIQEGMIGLFKAIRDYSPKKLSEEQAGGFSAFAKLCVSRQLYSVIQASNRQKHKPLNSYVELSPQIQNETGASLEQNPEELLIDQENVAALQERLQGQLSEFENQVLGLYLDGENYQEIGARLGKTAKSIDNALQRIRRKAEKIL